MRHQRLRLFLLYPLLATADAPVTGEPLVLVCRGHEPEWNLRIDGSTATLATLGSTGLVQTGFEGRLQETAGRPPAIVYRARTGPSGSDLVAVITREACVDTMADAPAGGDTFDHTARVSLPDGAIRLGCCSIATPAPRHTSEPPVETAASPAAAPVPTPVPATAPAPSSPPTLGGVVTTVTLPDGTECQSAAKDTTLRFRGRPVSFDCGRSGGDTVALVGPLTLGPEGLLVGQKAFVMWRSSEQEPRQTVATALRPSEIVLADGLTCRFAGTGATLAFEGRRASYTCGMKDGDTVALLGELEPVEGAFQIVRARIAHGESGFTLRSSETILVAAPR